VLTAAYLVISAGLFADRQPEALRVVLLGVGGSGLGTSFSAMLDHLTTAATPRYAAEISGVFTTCLQVAGTIGVAAFGTASFSLHSSPGAHSARHAFAVVTAAFAATALASGAIAYRATRRCARGEAA
jgi:hypothetical protein